MQNPAHRQLLLAERSAHEQEESAKKRLWHCRNERTRAKMDLDAASANKRRAALRHYRVTYRRCNEALAAYTQTQIDHDIAIGELDDFEHGRLDMFELGLAA